MSALGIDSPSSLQIQKGERGRWRKKPVVSKSVISRPVSRRTLRQAQRPNIKAVALPPRLAMNFIAASEPKDDEQKDA